MVCKWYVNGMQFMYRIWCVYGMYYMYCIHGMYCMLCYMYICMVCNLANAVEAFRGEIQGETPYYSLSENLQDTLGKFSGKPQRETPLGNLFEIMVKHLQND